MNPILPRALLAGGMCLETAEYRTGAYFETIRNQPEPLARFVREMPKGGDLHNHLSGVVYAESYIQWALTPNLNEMEAHWRDHVLSTRQAPNAVPKWHESQ